MQYEILFKDTHVALRGWGTASQERLELIHRELVRDRRWRSGMRLLVDYTGLRCLPLFQGSTRELAAVACELKDQLSGTRCALVGGTLAACGFLSLYDQHLGEHPTTRAVFTDLAPALNWLLA